MYQFVKQHSWQYPVETLGQVVGVSRSAYYALVAGQTHQAARKEDQQQTEVIPVFGDHKRRYGRRRIGKELQAQGQKIGRDKVRDILFANGLIAIQPRRFVPRTPDSRHTLGFSPNLLLNRPHPTGPNQVWVSEITCIMLANGQWI